MTENLLDGTDLPPVLDEDKDYFSDLVGDGKKYKDQNALAKSKIHGDQTIEIFKRRMDEATAEIERLRQENTSRANTEELVDQLMQRFANRETNPAGQNNPPTVDLTQIESLVSSKIQQNELSKRQAENFNFVKGKLQERYGDNYKKVIAEQIAEMEMTDEELSEMARNKPRILLKTLGLDQEQQQQPFQSPPRSNQRADTFTPTTGPKNRTWAYYQELRKKDPNIWFDRKTAIQMQEDAIKLGDSFKDGDYYAYNSQ